MAPRPGASSSSTRASTRTPAGCTRRAASIMSTSSPRRSSDAGKGSCYRYGSDLPAARRSGRSRFATAPPTGGSATRSFTTYRTHHGPIVRSTRRPLDRVRDDGPAGRGARSRASCGPRRATSPRFMRVAAAQGEQLEQHDVRRRQGRDRLSPSAVRAAPRRPLRLHQAGRRQRPGDRLGWAARADRAAQRRSTRPTAGSQNTNDWPYSRGRRRTARSRRTSPDIWTCSARTFAASTRCSC